MVSHNDSDHTGGVCELLNWLKDSGKYTVRVFTHQYLKYVDKILDTVDDGRRDRESLKKSLLEKFDHIKEIIETATDCGFDCVNAVPDTAVGTCTMSVRRRMSLLKLQPRRSTHGKATISARVMRRKRS